MNRISLWRTLALPLLCLAHLSPATIADERTGAFAAALDAYVEYHQFAGVALVAQDGETLFERAVGLADREWGTATTIDTKYQIGSVTKPMTATLAMRFVEQGLLALDDTVTRHLPGYPADPGDRITIHHLLSHTSGIPGYSHFENPREDVFRRKYTAREYIDVFDDLPLLFEPGESFEYSGFGYYLLGVILERVGNAPLDQLLQAQVFEPAGMQDSLLDVGLPIARRASPYQYDYDRVAYRRGDDRDVSTAFSTGGVFSTVHDLLAFRRATDSGVLLSAESVQRMTTPVHANYAYGWVVAAMPVDDGRGSVPMIHHNGGIGGYTANLLWFPEDRITVIVLCNTRGYKDTRLPSILASIAHGGQPTVDGQLGKRLYERAVNEGADAAIEEYGMALLEGGGPVTFVTDDPNSLIEAGERLLDAGHAREAVALLEVNLGPFPDSARTQALIREGNAVLAAPLRVLFVGNSYTYYNDLPGMFAEIVSAAGVEVEVQRVTMGAAKLIDHVEDGAVASALEGASWDWVVFQAQSTLGTNRFHDGRSVMADLEEYESAAASLLGLAHDNGTQPIMLLTWAHRGAEANQAVLNAAVVRVAARGNAVVVPAGPAWMEALEASPELPLYMGDGSHPAPAGTYLAAYTVIREIFGPAASTPRTDFSPFGSVPERVAIEADAALTIRAAVDRTVRRTGTTGRGLPQRTHDPVLLETPPSSSRLTDDFVGLWSGAVPFFEEQPSTVLELELSATGQGSQLVVELLFDHDRLRTRPQQLQDMFPNQSSTIEARVDDGRLVLEHPAQGFGSTYHYELGWNDGQLTGWVQLDAGGRTFYTATIALERVQ